MGTRAWVEEGNSSAAAASRAAFELRRTWPRCRSTAASSPLCGGGGNGNNGGEGGVHNSVNDVCYCAPVVRVRERKEK